MGLVTLGVLSRASSAEAARFLGDAPVDGLVEAVRATSDAELESLIGRDEIRSVAIVAVLGRLPELVLADRLAGVTGTARVEVEHAGRVVARHALVVDDGALDVVADVEGAPPAGVVLRAPWLLLLRLISGERNAGLEYLAGRLAIEGDAELALALGGMFPLAGAPGTVAVDPRALDPAEVSRAIAGVPTDHLRRVLASGFRAVVLDEIFRQLPAYVNQQRARGLRMTVGFRLTGRDDEEVERYVISLSGGTATVLAGTDADAVGRQDRDATVTAAAHDFLRLVTGHLSPVTGVLRGQLKVRGDKAAALRLAGAFDIPTAAAG